MKRDSSKLDILKKKSCQLSSTGKLLIRYIQYISLHLVLQHKNNHSVVISDQYDCHFFYLIVWKETESMFLTS